MNLKIISCGLLIVIAFSGCSGTKTGQLWTEVYPDYYAVNIKDAPHDLIEFRNEKIMNGDNWYWSPDGSWIFIKRPLYERCFGYVGKGLGTPIAMSWDGVIITAKTLDGSISDSQGSVFNGMAQLASIINVFAHR